MESSSRTLAIFLACTLSAACWSSDTGQADAIAEVQRSHIEANTPSAGEFERLLERDLTAYFVPTPSDGAEVEYEFLRDGPTQSGVSYPKYYLWIVVRAGDSIRQEGAVRVAAIDRERFEVTHFLSRDQIASEPSQLYKIFPAPVSRRIEDRVRS